MTHMMKQFLITAVLLLTAVTALAANITASVSRNPVTLDESFSLILKAEGQVSGEPNLSPLKKDFEVLGTSQSTSMNYVNGNFSRKTVWTIDLISKNVGVLTIPSIRFGKDSSPSLRLTVKDSAAGGKPASDQPISIEVSTDKQTVWQQAQLILDIKLYHKGNIRNASISEIETSDPYAIVEQLGEDSNYEVVRNGVRYGVIERKYAIFPQTSGKLTIKPIRFEAQIGATRRSFFDPFVNGVLKRVHSAPIEVEVKPIPAGVDSGDWLPAEQVLIKEEWSQDPSKLTAGEPVTRTITLAARGMLASQLPDINLPETDGVKHYPDKPVLNSKTDGNGVVASKQIKIAMIPAYGGSYTLPAVRIPWWNTRTGKAEVATLPAKTLVVSGSAKPATTPSAPTVKPDKTTPADDAAGAAPAEATQNPSEPVWKWISLALAIGWGLTITAWIFSRRKAPAAKPTTSVSKLRSQVLYSCKQNDARGCKNALLAWANARWPTRRIGNLMDIVPLVDDASANAIRELNSTLYSDHADNWHGDKLAQAFRKLSEKTEASPQDNGLVEPLFKIH